MDFKINETRVKKYKSYRIKIKKEYDVLSKKIDNDDFIKKIERKISKVFPSLLIDSKDFSPFNFVALSVVDEYAYITELILLVNQIKDNKYSNLLMKIKEKEINLDSNPSFDREGNVTNVWLKNDLKHKELLEIRTWIISISKQIEKIETDLKKKLFSFKDVLYKTQDKKFSQKLLAFKIESIHIKKEKKYLVLLNCLNVFVFFGFLTSIIFLIVYFFGGA